MTILYNMITKYKREITILALLLIICAMLFVKCDSKEPDYSVILDKIESLKKEAIERDRKTDSILKVKDSQMLSLIESHKKQIVIIREEAEKKKQEVVPIEYLTERYGFVEVTPEPTAKLIVNDLIDGEACEKEVVQWQNIASEQENRVVLRDSIIKEKSIAFELMTKSQETADLHLRKTLEQLEKQRKKEKLKLIISAGAGIILGTQLK